MIGRDDSSAASKNSGDVEMASHAIAETHLDHLHPSFAAPSPRIDEEDTETGMKDDGSGDSDSKEDIDADDDGALSLDTSGYAEDGILSPPPKKTGFVKALIDSTIPRDFIDQSVGIVKGDYNVEKKSLLNHAATSDQYDLFSSSRRFLTKATKHLEGKD